MDYTKLVICKKCWGTGHVNGGNENSTWSKTCEDCHGIGFSRVPMTNADRIRAMSDEELAKWITYACDVDLEMFCSNPKRTRPCDNNCDLCAIDWLEQPAEEEV